MRSEPTVIPDCCEVCLGTITNCVGLKKKPRKTKPKGGSMTQRQRKPRGKASAQAELPTTNGAPAKPSVPPPPEA